MSAEAGHTDYAYYLHIDMSAEVGLTDYAYILHIDMSAEVGLTDYGQHLSIHDSVMHICCQQFKSEFLLHNLASEVDTRTLFYMGAV
jgi:hypothetical protein